MEPIWGAHGSLIREMVVSAAPPRVAIAGIAGNRLSAHDVDALAGGLMAARRGGGRSARIMSASVQGIRSRFRPGSLNCNSAIAEWTLKYGHRGFKERDRASPRWRKKPAQVEILAEGL